MAKTQRMRNEIEIRLKIPEALVVLYYFLVVPSILKQSLDILWHSDDWAWIRMSRYFSTFGPQRATKSRILWMKKKLMAMKYRLKALPELRGTRKH